MSTAHNEAQKGDFGKTVLMPGDPLRSRFVAENFLENAKLVNNIRGVQGYTGYWKGVKVSVMASGMGIPAIGIYSHELFTEFDVDNIIRIGSCGAIQDDMNVGDIVLAQGASTNSAYVDMFDFQGKFAPLADWRLLSTSAEICRQSGLSCHVGNVYSSDFFYNPDVTVNDKLKKMGILAVEMEAAGLYANAAACGKRALAILTVSDHIFTHVEMPPEKRETGLTDMIRLSLDTAAALEA